MRKDKEHMDDDANWQSYIEKANLNDDNWNVKVVMIEASEIEQESMYLKEFEKGAAQGNRFVIRNISKIETLFMIKQLGGQNKTVRVFVEAQSYLKDNKNIPAEILALLIKHLILKMKEEYLYVERQKLAVKEGLQLESEIMISKVEVKGKINTRVKKSADSSTSKHKSGIEKKDSSSVVDVDDSQKYHTALRMRGEEWKDKEYLEDFPEDGPNLYVAITGFTEPYLPGCLIRIGVPLIAIVKLVIEGKTIRTPSKLSRNIKSDTDVSKKCRLFWDGLHNCRSECDRETLKNTAMVVFSPSLFDKDINLNDPDVIVNNQEQIYNEICYLMYDLQDLTRQHAHFLNNFQVSMIPDEEPNERLQRDYSKNNNIPLECSTIYSILDNLLQTVSKIDIFDKTYHDNISAANFAPEKDKSLQAETFIKEVFCKLRNNDIAKKKYRVTNKNEFENELNPIVIHFGDRFRYSTFHLSECSLHDAIWSMLRGSPVINIWQSFQRPSGQSQARINFHINLLSSFFYRKIEVPELIRLIQILNCTKLYSARNRFVDQNKELSNNTSRKGLLKRSYLVEPLALDPLIKNADFNSRQHQKLFQLPRHDTQTLYVDESVQKIDNNKVFNCDTFCELLNDKMNDSSHITDDFEYFEEFKGIVALQVLNQAYNKYYTCIYDYCEVTDTLTVMFCNRCKDTGLSREEWRGHIATPICLQDFFEFVLDEKYYWIQKEEIIYEQRLNKTATKVAEKKKKRAISGCCEDADEFDLLMEGSLKHRDMLDSFYKSSPEIQESEIKITSISSRKLPSKMSIASKFSGRSKMLITSLSSSESNIGDESLQEIFNGYNLTDRRVEVIGRESTYISKDGSLIASKYTSFLHIDSKYLSLNVVVGKNEFWIHRIVGADTESKDRSEYFRICTKHKMYITVKKEIQSTINKFDSRSFTESVKNPLTDRDKKRKTEVVTYSLSLVWPNGLITETIPDCSKHKISYIKQSFSLPHYDKSEVKRCINMNGEVIIFHKNGNIEILQPAGAYINISKFEMKSKSELDTQEIKLDEISQRKNNKTLGKRNRKVSNAQAKQPDNGEDTLQFQNIEPELIFHEYETIDSSGLRQKWMQDVLLDEQKLLSRTASDYCLGEVLTKRSDGTIIFIDKYGNLVTTYPNKTRITTSYVVESEDIYPEYSVYELDFNEQIIINKNELYLSIQIIYTIEHPDFTTVTINRSSNSISIESPNNVVVTLTNDKKYEFDFDNNTVAEFSEEILKIYSNRNRRENVFTINCNSEDSETVSNVWLHMNDSFDKDIIVQQDGEISVTERNTSDEKEESVPETLFNEWKRSIEAKAVQFFILKRDLSCANLVHRDLVKQYEETYATMPWSSRKVFKCFGDYRNLVSIVTPILLTAPERWKMESKFSNKQRRLVYKDLKQDDGKGFYHWMRPYKLYEPKSIAPVDNDQQTLPKAYVLSLKSLHVFSSYILEFKDLIDKHKRHKQFANLLTKYPQIRTLERQWDDNNKVCLRNAQELKTALEKYNRAVDSNKMYYANPPLEDFRCNEDIIKDDILQNVAKRVYEDLAKRRAAAGIELSDPITITTKPWQGASSSKDEEKELENSHESVIDKVEELAEMKPALKEYWRRRKEEYEEEQRNKFLLREGHVPPYFRNVLGGAIWLENQNMKR